MLAAIKRHFFFIAAGLLIASLGAAAALRYLGEGEDAGGGPRRGGDMSTPVIVHEVAPYEFVTGVEALGTARANESVVISSKVTDIIARIRFESGDVVQRGQVLVELASVEQGADLEEARAQLAEARREYDRFTGLVERGVAPRARLDDLRTGAERAEARVSALEARLADRVIRAPFSGVIGLRQTSPGELARPGAPIATLDDVSVIQLDIDLPERELARIAIGQTIVATAAAFPERTFTGEITEINSRVDPATRTVRVRADLPNGDGFLRPGMLLTAQVREDAAESLAVPAISVLRRDDMSFVYIVEAGERGEVANMRTITTGRRAGGMVEILSGLAAGDRVVEEGVVRLRPGAPVTVLNADSGAKAEGPPGRGRG